MPFNRRRLSFRGCLPEKYAAAQQNTMTQKVINAEKKSHMLFRVQEYVGKMTLPISP